MITGAQCLAARKLLKWSRQHLADKALLSLGTIRNIEMGKGQLRPQSLSAVRRALEAGGVLFDSHEEPGVGVRLRDRRGRQSRARDPFESVSKAVLVDACGGTRTFLVHWGRLVNPRATAPINVWMPTRVVDAETREVLINVAKDRFRSHSTGRTYSLSAKSLTTGLRP